MEQSSLDAVKAVLDKEPWTLEDYSQLMQDLAELPDPAGKLKASIAEMENQADEVKGAAAVKVGIARYAACRFAEAVRDLGWPPPLRVVPTGDGGISFERREGSVSQSIEIAPDGSIEMITIVASRLVHRQRLC